MYMCADRTVVLMYHIICRCSLWKLCEKKWGKRKGASSEKYLSRETCHRDEGLGWQHIHIICTYARPRGAGSGRLYHLHETGWGLVEQGSPLLHSAVWYTHSSVLPGGVIFAVYDSPRTRLSLTGSRKRTRFFL